MSVKKTVVQKPEIEKTIDTNDMFVSIINYVVRNEWDFTVNSGPDSPVVIELPLFDGRLSLFNDGSYTFS